MRWLSDLLGTNRSFHVKGSDPVEIDVTISNDGGGTAVLHYRFKPISGLPLVGNLLGGAGCRPWTGSGYTGHSTAAYHLVASEDHTETAQGTDVYLWATPLGGTHEDRVVAAVANGDGDLINSLGVAARKLGVLERGRGFEILREDNTAEYSAVSFMDSPFGVLFRGYTLSGTFASPAQTLEGNGIGVAVCGHDGTNLVGAKGIWGFVTLADWTGTSTPVKGFCDVTAPGTTTRIRGLEVTHEGLIDVIGHVRDIVLLALSASRNLAQSDRGRNLVKSGSTAYTVTIQPNSTVAITTGVAVTFSNQGGTTSNLTIARGSGVAIYRNGTDADIVLTPGQSVTLTKLATDVWQG